MIGPARAPLYARPSDDELVDYLPARMINEYVYCPRLFYLMHVEGLFEHNAETVEGENVHQRVDARADALAAPKTQTASRSDGQKQLFDGLLEPAAQVTKSLVTESTSGTTSDEHSSEIAHDEPESVHARSVTLSSDRLRVVAKLDLVEAEGSVATPVDYKKGKPRRNADGTLDAWEPEKIQLCLQALVLRNNGFQCDTGVIYYRGTRQRVSIPISPELAQRAERAVEGARQVAEQGQPPAPLVASPKCPKCSLSAVCLPDETNRCRAAEGKGPQLEQVRLPATARDDLKSVYLNTQGLYIGKTSDVLQVKDNGKVVQQLRIRELSQINLFGNIQISTQALQTLAFKEKPVLLFSKNGYFYGVLQGTGLKNILLRREQFRMADDPRRCLEVAKDLIAGKIKNQRVLLMRNHVDPPAQALRELKRLVERAQRADTADELLGVEGYAARLYFEHFSGMIKPGDEPIDSSRALAEGPQYDFDFRSRNRRPPRDPVNALLSLAYSLLSKDLTVAAAGVGFDPYLGFYHLPRPGRPALALDLMEPFRPLLADSAVITAINNRMVYPEHFVPAGQGVSLTSEGRKAFFRAYEQRMDQLVTHPLFDYRVSYRRLLEIQTRLLARVVQGELAHYPPFVTR